MAGKAKKSKKGKESKIKVSEVQSIVHEYRLLFTEFDGASDGGVFEDLHEAISFVEEYYPECVVKMHGRYDHIMYDSDHGIVAVIKDASLMEEFPEWKKSRDEDSEEEGYLEEEVEEEEEETDSGNQD